METIDGGSSELSVQSAVVIDGCRASKKQIIDTEDKELISSGHVVLSNDDLLIEILLRSPVLSIIRWKSVSKRWLSLITTPAFAIRRSKIPNLDPPSGIFLRLGTVSSIEYKFVPLDTRIPASRSPPNINFTLGSAAGKVEILQSCNGLLLCRIRTGDQSIYICNPSLNLFKMLPKEISSSNIGRIFSINGIKLAFNPTKSPHYKVIRVAVIQNDQHDRFTQIQIYSSETCSWSVSVVHVPSESFLGFHDGIYWNDAIFWLSSGRWGQVTHFNLNVQHPPVRIINTPKREIHESTHKKLFESRGCLLLVCKAYSPSKSLSVYEMSNENSEWLLKYHVNLHDINIIKLMSTKWFFFCVRFIVLGETEDESFLVLEIDGVIFKYSIVLRTLSRLFDRGSVRVDAMLERFDGLPFVTSLAGV